ncbi:MAG: hypothetical protein JRD93_19340 [Deltaproteobacteria bacterium]|nr:hypothetical protein [Deltaproteobacteria bacterium]
MQQIEITGEALPIVKSSIVLKEKLLSVKAVGDDAEWFDWFFVYEAYNKIIQQKKIIKGLFL